MNADFIGVFLGVEIMNFVLGIIFVVVLFFAVTYGGYLGLQMAVDRTKRNGYFEAYGKKWRAVELESDGNA